MDNHYFLRSTKRKIMEYENENISMGNENHREELNGIETSNTVGTNAVESPGSGTVTQDSQTEHLSNPNLQELLNIMREMNLGIQQKLDKLNENQQQMRAEFLADLSNVKAELATQLNHNICEVRSEITTEVLKVQVELTEQLETVRSETVNHVTHLERRIETTENVFETVNERFHDIEEEIQKTNEKVSAEVKTAINEEMKHFTEKISGELGLRFVRVNSAVNGVGERVNGVESDMEEHNVQMNAILNKSTEDSANLMRQNGADLILPSSIEIESRNKNCNVNADTIQSNALNANLNQTSIATLLSRPSHSWTLKEPRFAGKSNENPVTFLKKLEDYVKLYQLNDDEVLRCLNGCLVSTAYFWWNIIRDQIKTFDQFKLLFLEQYWDPITQGRVRSFLHTERFIPGRGKTLEDHLQTMFEVSRHLTPPLSDPEFISIVFSQLPYKYQLHWGTRRTNDLNTFRSEILTVERLEKQLRNNNLREEVEEETNPRRRSPPRPPLYNPHNQPDRRNDHNNRPQQKSNVNMVRFEYDRSDTQYQRGYNQRYFGRRRGGRYYGGGWRYRQTNEQQNDTFRNNNYRMSNTSHEHTGRDSPPTLPSRDSRASSVKLPENNNAGRTMDQIPPRNKTVVEFSPTNDQESLPTNLSASAAPFVNSQTSWRNGNQNNWDNEQGYYQSNFNQTSQRGRWRAPLRTVVPQIETISDRST